MTTYQTMPVIVNEAPVPPQATHAISRGVKVAIALLGGVAVLLVIASSSRSSFSEMSVERLDVAGAIVSSPEETDVEPCTFDECSASNCNHEVAPYTCLRHNGGPHGGCSPVPWISWTCDKQCDLSGCDDMSVPEDTATCDDKPCDESWCENGRLCGPDVPYQCTGGSATFGCSDDLYQWTFKTSYASCTSCCNILSCE